MNENKENEEKVPPLEYEGASEAEIDTYYATEYPEYAAMLEEEE